MDHMFQRFEERFVEIVDRLDACGLDMNRGQNDDRRQLGVDIARGEPIDRT